MAFFHILEETEIDNYNGGVRVWIKVKNVKPVCTAVRYIPSCANSFAIPHWLADTLGPPAPLRRLQNPIAAYESVCGDKRVIDGLFIVATTVTTESVIIEL